MTDGPLTERYFEWLYSQVGEVDNINLRTSFRKLLRVLHTTEFVWSHPRDENRAKDGMSLRVEFLEQTDADTNEDPSWINEECDMLELCIGLSRLMAFVDFEAGDAKAWFWELMKNLGLYAWNDSILTEQDQDMVRAKLDAVISKNYTCSGEGGLFPLDHPQPNTDQRKLELWDQLNAYLLERA